MKKLFIILLLGVSENTFSQTYTGWLDDFALSFPVDSKSAIIGRRIIDDSELFDYELIEFVDTSSIIFLTKNINIRRIGNEYKNIVPTTIISLNDTGALCISNINQIPLTSSQISDALSGYTPIAQVNSDWNSSTGKSQILNKPSIPTAITYYDSTGSTSSPTKIWRYKVTPTTGNGFSINISSAGFSSISSVSIISIKNTSTATSVPKVSIKSYTTSAIVVNIIEGNASTVNILSSLVSLGVSEQFANTTGLTLFVKVEGN